MFHRFFRLFTSRSETHYQLDVYIKNAVLLAAMRKNHNGCKGHALSPFQAIDWLHERSPAFASR
ncbi:hypothetical protein D6T51_08850 [Salmonella enterica subsp. enterica serovar Muenchen]|uniref:Uncharacterized protein n=1 Tax=Salmonella muenchen TaxID=596 RepID=A0A701SDA3_SALMU|nr:hypothetical protein [Salmonella enterica subsp. enterica]EBS1324237.1 hypothetical protein [Salmonella enterica subsp. enterica serovar Muenchen]EAW1376937.1 hypothetical protein [Salmonella enterica subsp. enterica]ECA0238346.1 hypothetical protein [Salmonella enterica subsp. enterica serovar Muenchen]ECC9277122.1 hypothetical protein [Salmonella enterica subsp. enterica]